MLKKAYWIAPQIEGAFVEDVYDVLLGNITKPHNFVAQVESLALEYDKEYEYRKSKLDS